MGRTRLKSGPIAEMSVAPNGTCEEIKEIDDWIAGIFARMSVPTDECGGRDNCRVSDSVISYNQRFSVQCLHKFVYT